MATLLLLTNALQPAAEVLPALGLLLHQVKVAPAEASALLEVLDPEQNSTFSDHYLEVDFDLSHVMFITTANTLPDIPLPLQDRMEIIRLPGYTEYEKYNIAKNFLVAKQIEANGLQDKDIRYSKNAILTIIRRYTREAGVRNLEREISKICRKVVKDELMASKRKKISVTPKSLEKYLGVHRFRYGRAEESRVHGGAVARYR